MGNCVSLKEETATATATATAKVIHVDGMMEQYAGTVRAGQVASRSPGCYVCSSEAMAVGTEAPGVPEAEELKPGELYFLMPVSKSSNPLSLPDLCRLAITANSALRCRPQNRRLKC